jgi:hypothetical protein
LLVNPVGLCVRTLRRVVYARQVAKRLVTDSTWRNCNLKCSTDSLVEFFPVTVGRPTSVVRITLALVRNTVHILALTDPISPPDSIGGQKYGCK